jgi:hypothetical protein
MSSTARENEISLIHDVEHYGARKIALGGLRWTLLSPIPLPPFSKTTIMMIYVQHYTKTKRHTNRWFRAIGGTDIKFWSF